MRLITNQPTSNFLPSIVFCLRDNGTVLSTLCVRAMSDLSQRQVHLDCQIQQRNLSDSVEYIIFLLRCYLEQMRSYLRQLLPIEIPHSLPLFDFFPKKKADKPHSNHLLRQTILFIFMSRFIEQPKPQKNSKPCDLSDRL